MNALKSGHDLDHSVVACANGVCLMSSKWKDEQHPSLINFISSSLSANSFRLNIVSIAPDFIFNCGGVSVAFVFVANCDSNFLPIFERVKKLKVQFQRLYVVVKLQTKEQIECFSRSYFKFEIELGRPPFVPVQDLELGFENIVRLASVFGAMKQQDAISKLAVEREEAVQSMEVFAKVVSSIPGIDSHDACMLNQGIGSIEAIAKASKEYIVENTDVSAEKAETIVKFFSDPNFYLAPNINREGLD